MKAWYLLTAMMLIGNTIGPIFADGTLEFKFWGFCIYKLLTVLFAWL